MDIQLDTHRRKSRLGRHWQPMRLEDLTRIEDLGLRWPAIGRSRWALWINVIVPGSGLIALQREASGLPLAVSFYICAQTALLGLLIVPKAMGSTITTAAAVLAAAVWLVSQVLMLRRIHDLQDLERQIQAAARIDLAREAVLTAEWGTAKQLLAEAADYDIEQPELNWLMAKVYSAVAGSDQSARQWRLVRQVDRSGRYERDIQQALWPAPAQPR